MSINKPTLNIVTLDTDVSNSTTSIADVNGMSFPVIAGKKIYFYACIFYTAAAATTGSRWGISGPANPTSLIYSSECTLTATTQTINYCTAYDMPAAANASSLTTGNISVIEGFITPSIDGTVILRFASEVASSMITAKAGSILQYQQLT